MLVVLIVLYVGSQLGSTLLMSSTTMEPTQRYMMLALPFVFVIFVIRFPAGLLVYWITTNLWTIGQQYAIRRKLGPATPPRGAVRGRRRPAAANGAGESEADATEEEATRSGRRGRCRRAGADGSARRRRARRSKRSGRRR